MATTVLKDDEEKIINGKYTTMNVTNLPIMPFNWYEHEKKWVELEKQKAELYYQEMEAKMNMKPWQVPFFDSLNLQNIPLSFAPKTKTKLPGFLPPVKPSTSELADGPNQAILQTKTGFHKTIDWELGKKPPPTIQDYVTAEYKQTFHFLLIQDNRYIYTEV